MLCFVNALSFVMKVHVPKYKIETFYFDDEQILLVTETLLQKIFLSFICDFQLINVLL